MGFKLPGKSIQTGTSGHSSALKMVAEQKAASALKAKASPAKSPEYDAAAKKDSNLGSYVAERTKIKAKYGGDRKKYRASEEYKANQSKINKAYGIDDGYVAPTTTTTTTTDPVKEEKQPRVEKTKYEDKDKSKTVYRKDNETVKKRVYKNIDEDEDGRMVRKEKATFRKDGGKKKYVHKEKDSGYNTEGKYRTKTKVKYDKEGDVKRKKEVDVRDGRRTVTKTNKKGETKTKSRRTLKGILTGKGKKKKEE